MNDFQLIPVKKSNNTRQRINIIKAEIGASNIDETINRAFDALERELKNQ